MRLRRSILAPFVARRPTGARVRTRLVVKGADDEVLTTVGRHLGGQAGVDLGARCGSGRGDPNRADRKRSLTAASSSRWAGAITRTSNDQWALGMRNLVAQGRSLGARGARIEKRLAVCCGERQGGMRGYHDAQERFQKQRRLQVLKARLAEVESRIDEGRVSVCRGGARLARVHHNLEASDLTEAGWRQRWEAARLFVTADGEADKRLGNETIRWDPTNGWLELRLPSPLAHLANCSRGRYRIEGVAFPYRGDRHREPGLRGGQGHQQGDPRPRPAWSPVPSHRPRPPGGEVPRPPGADGGQRRNFGDRGGSGLYLQVGRRALAGGAADQPSNFADLASSCGKRGDRKTRPWAQGAATDRCASTPEDSWGRESYRPGRARTHRR